MSHPAYPRTIVLVISLLRKGCLNLLAIVVIVVAVPLIWRVVVKVYFHSAIYDQTNVPEKPVALVFGAAVYEHGRLSPILRDRVDTAVSLYQEGIVDRIIMSGDNRASNYDEPGAMASYAIEKGVDPDDITADRAGQRTYDTCYRANYVFKINQAILVTQAFHLPRALMTCQGLGIDAVGVIADQRPYRGATWYEVRETAATFIAALDVARRKPPPIVGAIEVLNSQPSTQLVGGD